MSQFGTYYHSMNTKTELKSKAKSFSVRLGDEKTRLAYEHFCEDNGRSLDGQARFMITQILIERGYLPNKREKSQEVRE